MNRPTTRLGEEWGALLYRTSCSVCGEVVIPADESSLHVAGPKTSWRCTFVCPLCERQTLLDVPAGAGHLLVAAGARVTIEAVPAAALEPRPPAADRKLQLDDVIDFHELLSGDAWFDQLARTPRRPAPLGTRFSLPRTEQVADRAGQSRWQRDQNRDPMGN